MERIEKIERGEKQIIYFDLSGIKSNKELSGVVSAAKEAINAYSDNSVYTITNISGIAFDTKTKEIAAGWMEFNNQYVLSAAFIGATGVRKIMMSAVFALSNRQNVKLFHTMQEALRWIEAL